MRDLKVFAKTIEQEAMNQIDTLLSLDVFKECKVRIMPDAHAGVGCVIGFTADLGDKVIPNIVGVDISCGILSINLGKIDVDFAKLDSVIRQHVPSGRNVHEAKLVKFPQLQELKCYPNLKDTKRIEQSIGTLGGGNHFIEVDVDSNDNKYLIIHTGSRNLGKQVADYYQKLAYELLQGKDELLKEQSKLIERYKAEGRGKEAQRAVKKLNQKFKAKNIDIPRDIAYLSGEYRDQYLHDMGICQEYARSNRNVIAEIIIEKMGWVVTESFHTVHNYIDHASNIVRKGAISAQKGEKLIIPINMRDGCILGIGKGNEDWNYSAPHGAGRLMSRRKARESFNLKEYQNSMDGIYTTSVSQKTIDEVPMAYKGIDEIVECIRNTVDIIDIIKPVYNFKASE